MPRPRCRRRAGWVTWRSPVGSCSTSRSSWASCSSCGTEASERPCTARIWNGASRTPSRPWVDQQYRRYASVNAVASSARPRWRSASGPTSTPRAAAAARAALASGRTAPDAAPTAAYWERSSPAALRDQGISSASSSTQSVPHSSHSPAAVTAVRSLPRITSVSAASSRNGRPVRVYSAPVGPPAPPGIPPTPNRSRAAAASRQTSTTARDPMCFSSHTTLLTPSARYCAKASAGCSR